MKTYEVVKRATLTVEAGSVVILSDRQAESAAGVLKISGNQKSSGNPDGVFQPYEVPPLPGNPQTQESLQAQENLDADGESQPPGNPDGVFGTARGIDTMTKNELSAYAAQKLIKVDMSMSRQQMIDIIKEKEQP